MICDVSLCVSQPNTVPRLSLISPPQDGRMGMCFALHVIKLLFLVLATGRSVVCVKFCSYPCICFGHCIVLITSMHKVLLNH